MRILYFAKDAPYLQSGYGKCCREICTRLSRLGHEVAVFATVGNRSAFLFKWEGLTIYPGAEDIFGEDICLLHYQNFKADIFITQIDIWPLKRIHDYARQDFINWIPYAPIDSDPVPQDFIIRLKHARHIITMCNWAKEKLALHNLEATSIHHGINSNIYRILPNRENLKLELGFKPNTFLIGMVQANQFLRKAMEEQFRGIKIFKDKHPKIDIQLYCFTTPSRQDSYHLPSLVKEIGIEKLVKFPTDYEVILGFSEERMARIYNAFDVLLSATHGEGFCLPVIESLGCGTPVLATDCMSFPELVMYGELCKIKTTFTAPAMLTKPIPDEKDIAEKLWKMYNTYYNRREISQMAHYRWDWDSMIIPQWMTILDRIRRDIKHQCYKAPEPSKDMKRLGREKCVI